MLTATMLAIWLAIVAAPDVPVSRLLRRAFVIWPAVQLDRLRRGHVLFALVVLSIVAAAIHWGGNDAVAMLSMSSPELIAWTTMLDVATYFDLSVVLIVAATSGPIRSVAGFVVSRSITRSLSRTRRRKRVAHRAAKPHAANDGDPDRRRRVAA